MATNEPAKAVSSHGKSMLDEDSLIPIQTTNHHSAGTTPQGTLAPSMSLVATPLMNVDHNNNNKIYL